MMQHTHHRERIVIGGDELSHDYCAYVENITIARIYGSKDTSGGPIWSFNMMMGDAPLDTCLRNPSRRQREPKPISKNARMISDQLCCSDPAAYHLTLD